MLESRTLLGIEIKQRYNLGTLGDIYSIKSILKATHDWLFQLGIYSIDKVTEHKSIKNENTN